MRLTEIPTASDKKSVHAYMEVYEMLFAELLPETVLEIGVFNGDSHKLWADFLLQAGLWEAPVVIGFDTDLSHLTTDFTEAPYADDTVFLHEVDAYTDEALATLDRYPQPDVVIDDGPHTLESMLYACTHYAPRVAEGGLFVVEDVPNLDWIPQMTEALPANLRRESFAIDRRAVGTSSFNDDVLFVVRVP